jgi:hypothetical protein
VTQYLPSIYQPDGQVPSPELMDRVATDVDGLSRSPYGKEARGPTPAPLVLMLPSGDRNPVGGSSGRDSAVQGIPMCAVENE